MRSPFKYSKSSPELIRRAVMIYVRYPLSLRNVEDLLSERGIYICHETVRLWWNRFDTWPSAGGGHRQVALVSRDSPQSALPMLWVLDRFAWGERAATGRDGTVLAMTIP